MGATDRHKPCASRKSAWLVQNFFLSTSFFRCSHVGMIFPFFASYCLICSSAHPISDKDLRYCSSPYHLSRNVSPFFLFRAFLKIPRALKHMVCRIDGPCLASWEGLFLMTWPGIENSSNLSLFICRFLSVKSSKISVLPISVIKSFDSSLNGLISSVFLKSCSNKSLFGWFSNCGINLLTFSLRFAHLLNSGVRYTWNSVVKCYRNKFPCTDIDDSLWDVHDVYPR